SSAARSINASGSDAPSRKEKAERACSSTYSVIRPLHIPIAGARIERDAAHTLYALRCQPDIPLFTAPVGLRPPLSIHAPRPCDLTDGISLSFPKNSCRSVANERHTDGLWWTVDTKSCWY